MTSHTQESGQSWWHTPVTVRSVTGSTLGTAWCQDLAMAKWTAADIPDQTGRTIVITGANSGLGLRSAEALAAKGARVLMACRNATKAAAALEQVKAKATGAPPEVRTLDLSSLASVRACAEELNAELDHLDVLMNNAGIMAVPKAKTVDGFESQMGTNHLGHFALTGLLLPTLLKAPEPRVVTVSSNGHRLGRIDFDDLFFERHPLLAVAGLRADQARQPAVHQRAAAPRRRSTAPRSRPPPPIPATRPPTSRPVRPSGPPCSSRSSPLGDKLVGQPDHMGALPQLYAATMPDVRSQRLLGARRVPRAARLPASASAAPSERQDAAAAQRLWNRSEELTEVVYPWP